MTQHFKSISFAAIGFCLSACSTWAEPPEYLRIDQDVKVSFQSASEASRSCANLYEEIRGSKNNNIMACAYRKSAEAEPVVIIPNPCGYDDVYASLLCHELAHINQIAFNKPTDHEGWGRPAKLRKVKSAYPKLNTPSQSETVRAEVNMDIDAKPLELGAGKPPLLLRTSVKELVSFYDGNAPVQDVQRLKLRGSFWRNSAS